MRKERLEVATGLVKRSAAIFTAVAGAVLAVDNSRCAMLPLPYITTTLPRSIVRNTQ
jgi:hypothetical protein